MKLRIKKSQSALSLTATLAIAFLALSMVVLLISSGLQIFFNIQTQQEAISSKQQLVAQDAAGAVANFIQEKLNVLEAAVTFGDSITASHEEQQLILEKVLGLNPAFRHLVLFDAQEQELANASRLSRVSSGQLTDRVGSDYFAQVSQGKRHIGPIYIDKVSSEPMMTVAVPITDALGDFQGALMAEVKLKFMWDLVDGLKIGQAGVAYVVDKQGNLIAFGDVARVLRGENVSHLKEVGEFISNSTLVDETGASISSGINGTTIVGTFVPLGMPDWAVVTELPVREAYREIIQSTVISIGVVLVMSTLAGLSGAYVARRLAVPLLDLTETATQIAGGNLDLEATVEGPIETVRLADAFNSMTMQLRSLIGGLEQQVADRTRGLQTAAEVSHATTSVLDPDKLLRQAVDLVRDRFDLYYAGLFLLDEERRFAILCAGTGEAGQQMIAQDYKLAVGDDSMIGQCVAEGKARIADAGEEANNFDHPLLPDRRTELVLPLHSRGRTIGAMTVQSIEEAAFDEADVAVMQTMADQIAVAIENARLYEQAQQEISERMRVEEQLRTYAAEIHSLNERLKEENLRMEAELDVTRQLQQMLLPTAEELGQIEGLDIAGFMEPAEEVGGDYYDVLQHDGQLKIGIGDVTGHGLESGVVMLMIQTAVRTLLTNNEQDPVRFLNVLNRILHDNMQRMRVDKSMSLTLLDYQSGQGKLNASGQHEQILVVRQDGWVEAVDTDDLGFPLGLESGIARFVNETSIELQPGDGIVLYSDGITEAENAEKEFYGIERLCCVVSEHWAQSAEAIKGAVVADVHAFIGGHKVYDDLTLLIVKRKIS